MEKGAEEERHSGSLTRVARWFLFRPKIPILEDLGMENIDIYSGHLEYFTTIGYIL
jgi:hypothetical protein